MLSELKPALTAIGKAVTLWNSSTTSSLAEFTKPLRAEPIVVIDQSCLYVDYLPDIQNTLLNLFSAYYLMAATLLGSKIEGVDTLRVLDRINPSRNPTTTLGEGESNVWKLVTENYHLRLPRTSDLTAVMEADAVSDSVKELKELANLSIGKVLSVPITNGRETQTVIVNVRLLASSVPTDRLVHMLSPDSEDRTSKERWRGWKSGRLEMVRDLLLTNDLIDAHRKKLINADQTYSNIVGRRNKNALASLFSGDLSLATASNMVVTDTEAIEKLEIALGGSWDNFKIRQKVFDHTSLMIVAVIDKRRNRVSFYTRGMDEVAEADQRGLKGASKNNSQDVVAILQAMRQGSGSFL